MEGDKRRRNSDTRDSAVEASPGRIHREVPPYCRVESVESVRAKAVKMNGLILGCNTVLQPEFCILFEVPAW
eukprot:g18211.t1